MSASISVIHYAAAKATKAVFLQNSAISSFLISLFLHFPPLHVYLAYDRSSDRFGLMMQQADNPFNVRYDTIDNVLAYRLVVPLFNYFAGLRGHAIVLPSILGSFLLCVIITKIFRDKCDHVTSFLLTLSVALSFLVVSGTCFWCATDSLAFFLVLAIMFCSSRFLVSLLVFLSLSVDERTIVSLALLPILKSVYRTNALPSLRYTIYEYASYAPGLLAAIILRAVIYAGVGFPSPVEHYQYNIIEQGLASGSTFNVVHVFYDLGQWILGLKWLWFFPAASVLTALFLKDNFQNQDCTRSRSLPVANWTLLLGLGIVVAYFIASLPAGDEWRCALYVFPAIIASALYLYNTHRELSRMTSRWIALLSVFTPQVFLGSYSGWETSLQAYWPLPWAITRYFIYF
jgi:hypothetical protein